MWQSKGRKASQLGNVHCTELRQVKEFHLKRVECEVSPLAGGTPEAPIRARLLLNDLNQKGVALYSKVPLTLGSILQIEIRHPEPLSVKVKVGWCQMLTTVGRVITPESPAFRIGLIFELETPEDHERVRAFSEKLSSIYPGTDLTKAPYAA